MKIVKLTSKNIMDHIDLAEQISAMSMLLVEEDAKYDSSMRKKWSKNNDKYYNLGYILTNYYTAYAVVLDNNKVAASLLTNTRDDDPNSISISFVYVLSEYRRLGYGAKLMKRVLADNRGKQAYMNCYCSNKSAMKFYRKLGFKPLRYLLTNK